MLTTETVINAAELYAMAIVFYAELSSVCNEQYPYVSYDDLDTDVDKSLGQQDLQDLGKLASRQCANKIKKVYFSDENELSSSGSSAEVSSESDASSKSISADIDESISLQALHFFIQLLTFRAPDLRLCKVPYIGQVKIGNSYSRCRSDGYLHRTLTRPSPDALYERLAIVTIEAKRASTSTYPYSLKNIDAQELGEMIAVVQDRVRKAGKRDYDHDVYNSELLTV